MIASVKGFLSSSLCRGPASPAIAGCLALVFLLLPAGGWSQEKPLPRERSATADLPPFSHFAALPSDPAIARKLQAARDYLGNEAWDDAVHVLQSVLEMREDVFVPLRHKDKNGKETVRRGSARAEARRMLASLPRRGQEFYETTFGPTARDLLDRAKKTNDPEGLARVARFYEHTHAGLEALHLLGLHHLDRGRHALAARCFRQLLERSS